MLRLLSTAYAVQPQVDGIYAADMYGAIIPSGTAGAAALGGRRCAERRASIRPLRWAAAGACYATAWAYIPVRSPSCGALVTTRSVGMAGQAPPRFARDLLPGPSSCGRSRQSVRLDAAERADADGRDTPPAGDRKPAGPGVSAREKAAVASKPTGTKSTGTDPKMMKLARYVYAAAFLAPPDVED